MNIILGFGRHHVDITRDFARRLGQAVLDCERDAIEETARAFCAAVPDHISRSGKAWGVAKIRTIHIGGYEAWPDGQYPLAENRAVTVEIAYWHYRNDHPFSPDGFAAWTHHAAVVAMRCGTYEARVYTSLDGGGQ